MKRQDNNSTQSAMFRVAFPALLFLTVASGGYSAWLAQQPNLTPYQIQVLTTSSQMCYGGSTTLFTMLSAKKLPRKRKLDSKENSEE